MFRLKQGLIPGNSGRARLVKFVWGTGALCALIYFIGPILGNLQIVESIATVIDEHQIEATALFYTEDPVTDAAVFELRHSMAYSPQGGNIGSEHPGRMEKREGGGQ